MQEKFKTLERFEVSIPDTELALLESLEPGWASFQGMLDDAAGTLERSKENFRYAFCAEGTPITQLKRSCNTKNCFVWMGV